MRRLLALLALLPFLLLGSACGGSDDDEGGSGDGTTTTSGDDEGDEPAIGADTTIELLDAGQEPRQVLRLRPPADCEQHVRQRQQVDQQLLAASVGDVQVPEDQLAGLGADSTSGNEFDTTYRCEELEDDRIAVTNTYEAVRSIGAEEDPQVAQMLESFVGAEGRIVYDSQGRIVDAEAPDIDIDEDVLGPAFAKAMEQMIDGLDSTIQQSANPFPDEPVGVGGKWRVTSEVGVMGLEARTITEYTVTRIDGDAIEASLALSMEFLPGAMDFPGGLPAGGGAEIVEGSMSGTGTTTWETDGVVAYFEQLLDGTMTMRIEAEGESIEMSMAQHQVMTLQPR